MHKFKKYIANICKHCDCLQNYNYIVYDPNEIWAELIHNKTIEKYFLENINLKEAFIPYKELNII